MRLPFLILMLSVAAGIAAPSNTVTVSVATDTNGALFGSSTNFAEANGIAIRAGYGHTTNFNLWADDGASLDGQVATLVLSSRVSFAVSTPIAGFGFDSDASAIGASLNSEYWNGSGWTNIMIYPCYSGSVYYAAGGPDGAASRTVSNWTVNIWAHTKHLGRTNDFRGANVVIDAPADGANPTTKGYVDAIVGAVTPANWASYPAVDNLRMNGHLILNNGWGLSMTGGVGIISYGDVWASTNNMVMAHNGIPVISLASGYSGLQITNFSIGNGTAMLWVATNGVVPDPVIQETTSLTDPNWQVVTADTSYPTVTNGAYLYTCAISVGGYYRAVQLSGTNTVTVSGELRVDNLTLGNTNAIWCTMDVLVPGGLTNTIRYLGAP